MKKKEFKKLHKIACSFYTIGETFKRNDLTKSEQHFLQYSSYLGYKIFQKARNYFHKQDIDLYIISRHQFAWQNRKLNSDDIYGLFDKWFQKLKNLINSCDTIPSVFKRLLLQTELKIQKTYQEYRDYLVLKNRENLKKIQLLSA